VDILLWLVPPVVVTLIAMAWVGWIGREGRGEVDPEVAVQRMAAALSKPQQAYATTPRRRERSTGVAVRPSSRPAVQKTQKRRAS
jgi:cytochrome c-type biogenesis protein CcmH/NrfF